MKKTMRGGVKRRTHDKGREREREAEEVLRDEGTAESKEVSSPLRRRDRRRRGEERKERKR